MATVKNTKNVNKKVVASAVKKPVAKKKVVTKIAPKKSQVTKKSVEVVKAPVVKKATVVKPNVVKVKNVKAPAVVVKSPANVQPKVVASDSAPGPGIDSGGSVNVNGKAVAMLISVSLTLLSIGVWFILAETNESVHDFLPFIPFVGGLSGRIILSYGTGIVSYLIFSLILRNKEMNLRPWYYVLLASLVLATVFVFTPFVGLFE